MTEKDFKPLWVYGKDHKELSENLTKVSGSPAKFLTLLKGKSIEELKDFLSK